MGITYLFVEEFKICRALIFHIFSFIGIIFPITTSLPFLIVFIFVVIGEGKVIFFGRFLSV